MGNGQTVKVWDPLLRIFHWSLVVAFTVAYLTGEEASALHVWSGYVVLGLLGFRLIWGLMGPRHARFSDFVRGPSTVLAYARGLMRGSSGRFLGHNPLGGWMIIALLLSLLGTTVTGLAVYGAEDKQGPLAGLFAGGSSLSVTEHSPLGQGRIQRHDDEHEREEGEEHEGGESETLEELHEVFANLTVLLVALHIAGILVGTIVHRENLVRAMITGRKPARS